MFGAYLQPEALLDEAGALASRIAVNPAGVLRLTKRLIREAQHVRLDTLLEISAAFQALAHTTDEHRSAVERMLERIERNGHG
jgi:enoyl-CoA hydratase/carnithine racemase